MSPSGRRRGRHVSPRGSMLSARRRPRACPQTKINYLKALPGSARTEGIQPTKAGVLSAVPIFQLRPTSVTRQNGRIPQPSDSWEGRVLEKSPFTGHTSYTWNSDREKGKRDFYFTEHRNTLLRPSNRKTRVPLSHFFLSLPNPVFLAPARAQA